MVLEHSGRDRLNQLLQTPRCDDGDGFLVDAGVVKLAGWQIRSTPVGGDGGDEDDFGGETAAELGLEEGVAFALDAEPEGVTVQKMETCWPQFQPSPRGVCGVRDSTALRCCTAMRSCGRAMASLALMSVSISRIRHCPMGRFSTMLWRRASS